VRVIRCLRRWSISAFVLRTGECYNEIAVSGNKNGYRLGARLEGIRRVLNELVLSTIEVI
jgi:hypothetical protein